MIKAWKNIVFIFVSISISTNIFGKIELIDRVVAVVDSGVIMESQLNARVEEILIRLKSDKAELPPLNLLEEQVLERLIIEEIQMQIADRAGIKISDSELNQTLSSVSSQNNLSLEEFRIKLEAEGHEIEVLKGSVNTLKNTEYITVDYGPEKGKEGNMTLPEVTNFLFKENFSKFVKFNT